MTGPAGESPERPKTQAAGRSAPSEAPGGNSGALEVGQSIDDFLLLDSLGEGAFAKVFLAHQQSLHRTVALKIFTDPSREAQTLAQVDHPNIVRVHDQRSVPGRDLQLLYMEYVAGGTLESIVERVQATPAEARSGRLVLEAIDASLAARDEEIPLDSMLRARLETSSWPEAVCLLGTHMAVALDFAHSRGVLHRDIKPANVLLDATGRAKLADFNISTAAGLEDEDEESSGGTLPYMAPEQVKAVSPWHEGAASDISERSDLYGLGIVLWELLTGDLPFPEPPDGVGMQEVIEHLIATREAGVAPSAHAAARAIAPAMMVDTLLACLAPDPADRPQSGAELRRRLEWCLDPELRRLFTTPEGSHFCRRTWVCRLPIVALVGAVLLPNALLSGLNVAFNVHIVVPQEKHDAFMGVVTAVNGIAFPLGIAIFATVAWALRKTVRRRLRGESTTPEERHIARKRGLRLGGTMAAVILPLWIVGGAVFPIWQQMEDGTADHQAWFNFTVSNTMFGLLAATLSYFLINAIVARVLLPRLVEPGDVDDDNAQRMGRLRAGLPRYFAGCVVVPFASVVLLAVGPNSMAKMGGSFLALGVMGALALFVSLSLAACIRADLGALERALAAPKDRFRAPV